MTSTHDISIVDYYAEHSGYRCGYCKSPNTNYSHGMWAHSLTVQDYQDLIDRGWRRSGCYCYKPTMHLTCCPMYTIKCSVLDFKVSKSQKKKLKRVHNFLAYGRKKSLPEDVDTESTSDMESADEATPGIGIGEFPDLKEKAQSNASSAVVNSVEPDLQERMLVNEDATNRTTTCSQDTQSHSSLCQHSEATDRNTLVTSPTNRVEPNVSQERKKEEFTKPQGKKGARPGDGMDPNRPMCKKAKLLRKERMEKKLAQVGALPPEMQKSKTVPTAKTLEDFINEPLPENPAHRLEIKLVRSKSSEMNESLETSWALFVKYQMVIHKEEEHECDMTTYTEFLVDTPLKPWLPKDGPPQGYGSFHQQYWLDGRLIAVGVLDILPYCVSSVYFFYDPEFHFLVLGTYGSLREIAFSQSLHHYAPSLKYYYMGFYIHSCPKMRYKGGYYPSFLLCPEVYSWHPIEYCIPLLEKNKYSRFNEDPDAKDAEEVESVNQTTVLFHHRAMTYYQYISVNPSHKHLEEVTQYANLVGNKLSKKMLLLMM